MREVLKQYSLQSKKDGKGRVNFAVLSSGSVEITEWNAYWLHEIDSTKTLSKEAARLRYKAYFEMDGYYLDQTWDPESGWVQVETKVEEEKEN